MFSCLEACYHRVVELQITILNTCHKCLKKKKQYLCRIPQSSLWAFELSLWTRDGISLTVWIRLPRSRTWPWGADCTGSEKRISFPGKLSHPTQPSATAPAPLPAMLSRKRCAPSDYLFSSLSCMTVSQFWIWQFLIVYGSMGKRCSCLISSYTQR